MAEQTLKLAADEALVLFEWLSLREKDAVAADRDMSAEDIVFAHLLGQLEKVLVEPFAGNYVALLNAARESGLSVRLRGRFASCRIRAVARFLP